MNIYLQDGARWHCMHIDKYKLHKIYITADEKILAWFQQTGEKVQPTEAIEMTYVGQGRLTGMLHDGGSQPSYL